MKNSVIVFWGIILSAFAIEARISKKPVLSAKKIAFIYAANEFSDLLDHDSWIEVRLKTVNSSRYSFWITTDDQAQRCSAVVHVDKNTKQAYRESTDPKMMCYYYKN